MRKFLVIIFSSFLLIACSKNELTDVFGEADETPHINEETGNKMELEVYDEFEKLNEVIADIKDYQVITETDNESNRVLLFEHDNKKQYKSIYVKNDQHVKVIDLQTDQAMYDDYLIHKVDPEIAEKNNSLNQYEEYATLSNVIDIFVYESKVETDNRGSRVILFIDAKGEKIYKSVYAKKKKHLKIIQLSNDELLFNESL